MTPLVALPAAAVQASCHIYGPAPTPAPPGGPAPLVTWSAAPPPGCESPYWADLSGGRSRGSRSPLGPRDLWRRRSFCGRADTEALSFGESRRHSTEMNCP